MQWVRMEKILRLEVSDREAELGVMKGTELLGSKSCPRIENLCKA